MEFARELEGLSWYATNRIFSRIIDDEIQQMDPQAPEYHGLDDIAKAKGQVYNTVASGLGEGKVIGVTCGRAMDDLEGYISNDGR